MEDPLNSISPGSGGRLEIDLAAIGANYSLLSKKAANAETAAAVKANAYGLGLEPVAKVLAKKGCKTYFVALPQEGALLRKMLPDATIYVLAGLGPKSLDTYISHSLSPVLNTLEDTALWTNAENSASHPYAIHFDTGMNRLGLSLDQLAEVASLKPQLIMSHFACADQPDHPLNQKQLERFLAVRKSFPQARASLANSAAILSRDDCQFDLVRPGIALYGGAAVNGVANPMRQVLRLEGRILQIRNIKQGDTIGYGATHVFDRDSRVAIVGVGYGDGYHRASEIGTKRFGAFAGQKLPLLGRISMDLSAFDVTDSSKPGDSSKHGDRPKQGDWIELIGENCTLGEVATATGTIDYEILTSLGHRFARNYING